MAKGPKPASKTTSSNRVFGLMAMVPMVVGAVIFLPPHLPPGAPPEFGLIFQKIGWLFKYNPICGIFLLMLTIIGTDVVAKLMPGGMKIGNTTELSDFEGQ